MRGLGWIALLAATCALTSCTALGRGRHGESEPLKGVLRELQQKTIRPADQMPAPLRKAMRTYARCFKASDVHCLAALSSEGASPSMMARWKAVLSNRQFSTVTPIAFIEYPEQKIVVLCRVYLDTEPEPRHDVEVILWRKTTTGRWVDDLRDEGRRIIPGPPDESN